MKALLTLIIIVVSPTTYAADHHFDWGGSFKSIFELQKLRQQGLYQYDTVPMIEERLRLQASVSNSWLRLEAANEASFIHQKENPSVLAVPDFTPNSAWNARWRMI